MADRALVAAGHRLETHQVTRRNFRPGTLIRVHWLDIVESWNESPEAVQPALFSTVGYFCGWHQWEHGWFLRTSNTLDRVTDKHHGACSFPEGCVVKVERVRR